MEDGTETPSENGSAISDVSQSGKDAIIAEEDSSGTREKFKCEVERISCLSLLSLCLSLSLIITRSFPEALLVLQLILMWIRGDKHPINGGLN